MINTSTAQRIDIVQIIVGIATAPSTAPSFYLSRVTVRGTATAAAGQPYDVNDQTSLGAVDSTYTVQPTFSTSLKLGQAGLAVTAGGYWVWDLRDYGITIPATAGTGLAIVNQNASGATAGLFTGSFIWEE